MKRYITALFALTVVLGSCAAKIQSDDAISENTDTGICSETYTDTSDTTALTPETYTPEEIYRDTFFSIVREEEGVTVMYNGELMGVYDDCFLLTDRDGTVNPQLVEEDEERLKIYSLDDIQKGNSYGIAQTAEQHGNYIVTERAILDANQKAVAVFHVYTVTFTTEEITVDGDNISVKGKNEHGETVTFEYTDSPLENADEPILPEITVEDEKIWLTYTDIVQLGEPSPVGYLTVHAPADSEKIGSFGEYMTYQSQTHLLFMDGGKVVYASEGNSFLHAVYDDFFAVGDEHYMPYIVYGKDFERAFDGEFRMFSELGDGNYIAVPMPTALPASGTEYLIYNAEKEVIYSGKDDGSGAIMDVGTDYVLRKKDNVLKLYTPYGELMCELGEVTDTMGFHDMLSGVGIKGDKECYYFIFEDSGDTDKDGNTHNIEYYYVPETKEVGIIDNGYSSFAYAKPVLYLYPTEETDITVTFAHPERLTTVYPAYNDGWSVTASPDGTLTDDRGRSYYALYWEETSSTPYYDFTDGFCVAGEDSAAFLEEKLAALGFTEREANEFVIYWLPIMEASEYNIVRFELTDEREASNALHITPKPDSLLRMAMHIKAVDEPVEIPTQELPSFERNGFTAVEWGGCVH